MSSYKYVLWGHFGCIVIVGHPSSVQEDMCFDIAQWVEYSCLHKVEVGVQRVDCNDRNCRFSQLHSRQPHNCQAQCKQALMAPQALVIEQRTDRCGACS